MFVVLMPKVYNVHIFVHLVLNKDSCHLELQFDLLSINEKEITYHLLHQGLCKTTITKGKNTEPVSQRREKDSVRKET